MRYADFNELHVFRRGRGEPANPKYNSHSKHVCIKQRIHPIIDKQGPLASVPDIAMLYNRLYVKLERVRTRYHPGVFNY